MLVAKKKKPKRPLRPDLWQKRLKALRDRHGLTQAAAAERADVPLRTWISWENRQSFPSRMALDRLRAAFPGEIT